MLVGVGDLAQLAGQTQPMRKSFILTSGLTGLVLVALVASVAFQTPVAQKEYMTMTVIESIIPAGLGRSRILIDNGGKMEELKINNIYSAVGINLQNVYDNDVMVTAKLNEYAAAGWHLDFVNTGVQSPTDGGKDGIYATRYIFSREN